jgi:hypothetical protein
MRKAMWMKTKMANACSLSFLPAVFVGIGTLPIRASRLQEERSEQFPAGDEHVVETAHAIFVNRQLQSTSQSNRP